MNKFEVISRLWPSGTVLNGGIDVNTVNPPGQNFTRTAPPLAAGPGAPNGYRFLFWNTGRRVTNKLQVTWTFNNLSSWTTWIATRWYGIIPGGGSGPNPKLITTTAFAMDDNASMSGTPIDGVNSTFTNGPAGQQAYPFGTPPNDRVASTQWGGASVVALDPFPPPMVLRQYPFVGWLQLILGGDETGQFDESDGAAVVGGGGFYSHLMANPVLVKKDETVDLMAAYRVINVPPVQRGPLDRITFIEWLLDYDRRVDPRPLPPGDAFDRLRIGVLAELFAVTRMGNAPEDVIESLMANSQSMGPDELTRAITSAKAIMQRAEAATKSLEAALSKRRKDSKA